MGRLREVFLWLCAFRPMKYIALCAEGLGSYARQRPPGAFPDAPGGVRNRRKCDFPIGKRTFLYIRPRRPKSGPRPPQTGPEPLPGGLRRAPGGRPDAPGPPKTAPGAAQDRPKTAPDPPRRAPGRPRTAPGPLQDGPRTRQAGPGTPQDGPRTPPRRSGTPPDLPGPPGTTKMRDFSPILASILVRLPVDFGRMLGPL